MKIFRITIAILLVAATVFFTSCDFAAREGAGERVNTDATRKETQKIEYSYDMSVVCGKEIRFVSEEEKQKWIEPLERLLSNVLIPYGEKGDVLGYTPTLGDDVPAVPQSHSCALLDVSEDGVPELLIQPYGGFGSSGVISFEIYDIYTGENMGYLDCGNAYSWSVYYRSDTGELDTVGRYWLRMGWAGRIRYVTKIEYDAGEAEYREVNYLRSEHEISMEHVMREDPYVGDEFVGGEYVERYPDTVYEIYGEETYMDDYFAEYDRFTRNYIRIPETELVILGWGEVAGDLEYEDHKGRAARMARALVGSAQRFVVYE